MSRLNTIKERAQEIAQQRQQTTDQEQARIERARMEARKEAKREKVQQRTQQARERERERVLNDENGGIVSSITDAIGEAAEAVDDGDNQRLDDVSRAMGTDFDGDGETVADELGLQSARRADAEDNALDGLSQQVDRNTGRIGDLEDMGIEPPRDDPQPRGGFGGGTGGGGGFGGSDTAGGFGGGDTAGGALGGALDPEDFGFGGGDDDDGGFFGGGGL